MVLDTQGKTVKMRRDFRLPYTYDFPYMPHMRPYTGIANATILTVLLLPFSGNLTRNKIEIVSDPTNPSIVSKTTILGQEKKFGKVLDPNGGLVNYTNYYFFYFDS